MRTPNFDFDITADVIQKHAQKISTYNNSIESGIFHCRTANACINEAKLQPVPKDLYKNLLIENELTILVADTGVGKSIFAVQIADFISKTEKVLYLDLELSDKQFQGRYSNDYQNEYIFNNNFYRCVLKRRYEIPNGKSYEEYFIHSLTQLIENTGTKVVIIDNMTSLISTDSDQARSAKPLMDSLNNLKFNYNLTMLLLEHTKKVDPSRPIHLNDLQGSKMKANFSDAIFTIGRSSKDKNLRYIKQLKTRSAETKFDSENVMVYEIIKDYSFLNLKLIEYGNEYEHLKQHSENDKASLIERAKDLKEQGNTVREIADALKISKSKVDRILKNN
ncbi:MAG: AAA family ATPase [Bacteroidetes bacterium]|nr:AAA family ATPase [Bacteroidota bacterium]